jgi:cytochrome c peroxidase
VAYYRWFFRDGRAATLWQQALQPMQDPREMGGTRAGVLYLLQGDPALGHTYEQIFGPLPHQERFCIAPDHQRVECNDPADAVAVNVAKALAAFVRTLVYRCSPFDRFADGLRKGDLSEQAAISDDAKRGLHLFLGRGRCVSCHHGPIFSDSEFHDARVPNWPDRFHEDRGRYDGIARLRRDPFGPGSSYSDARDGSITQLIGLLRMGPETLGQFKTPSLRNVELTGPYMHAGQYQTLEEVVEHYSEMADAFVLNHHDYTLMDPLHLSNAEKKQMIEFLKSLTDPDLKEGRYPQSTCRWP